jgi:hypothetical protein
LRRVFLAVGEMGDGDTGDRNAATGDLRGTWRDGREREVVLMLRESLGFADLASILLD